MNPHRGSTSQYARFVIVALMTWQLNEFVAFALSSPLPPSNVEWGMPWRRGRVLKNQIFYCALQLAL